MLSSVNSARTSSGEGAAPVKDAHAMTVSYVNGPNPLNPTPERPCSSYNQS